MQAFLVIDEKFSFDVSTFTLCVCDTGFEKKIGEGLRHLSGFEYDASLKSCEICVTWNIPALIPDVIICGGSFYIIEYSVPAFLGRREF